MAQTNFTPILIYASSTPTNVPSASNLTNSTLGAELAINIADKNLFFKDSTNAVNTVPIRQSSTSSNGWLSATDWNTFNNKAPATSGASILYGNGTGGFSNVTIGTGVSFVGGTLSATGTGGTVTSVTGTAPVVSSGGTTPAISMPAATTSVNGYLTSTDWNTFNNKQAAGTYVNSVSGTTGRITSTGGVTPVIDLASGVATAGTTGSSTLIPVVTIDTYGRVTSITTASNPQGTVTSVAALTLGTTGTDLSSTVATGTTTPVITLNVPTASATNRGALSAADWSTFNSKQPAGTYVTSVTGTAPVVSSGGTTPAISMAAATTSVNGYLTSTDWTTFNNKQPAGSYLTAVSIVSANGFAGTSSGGLTPALTLSTSITGLLKGNGTAISAATSGTDYAPATSGSSILYGNGAGGFSNVTIGTGLTFIGGTLASTASGGTVTSVAATVPAFLSISGSPITTSGTLAITLSGTALPVANGGTGITSLTANYIPYGNGTSGFSSSSTLTYNGTILTATQVRSATIGSATSSTLSLQANATTYATIAASGEFLVACTSLPAANRVLGFGAKNSASGGIQIYQVSSNTDWAINSASGSIANFYSDTGTALTYAGSISVTGNITTYGSVSDYRLKENIAPITGALEKISRLNPVTFDFKDNGQKSEGFIAHELQAIVPDAVTGTKDAVKTQSYEISPAIPAELDSDGKTIKEAVKAVMGKREVPDYQSVDTSFLIATLVAAVKELKVELDLLKAK